MTCRVIWAFWHPVFRPEDGPALPVFQKEFATNTSFPCPCCGYRTLDREPRGTLRVCAVCFWQDAAPGQASHNPVSLFRAQRNYCLFGAGHEDWVSRTRNARPDQARPPGWEPMDPVAHAVAERAAVGEQVRAAFAEVWRDDGVSLREAFVLDGYGTIEEQREARVLDDEDHWQEVPEDDLKRYAFALCFLDPTGFHYYAPAYVLWMLNRPLDDRQSSFLFLLTLPDSDDGISVQRFKAFDAAQSAAVCRFLRFLADHGGYDSLEAEAQEALDSYWRRFCGAE